MNAHAGRFGTILDAVAASHDLNAYINLLARDGNVTAMVGALARAPAHRRSGLALQAPQLLRFPHRRHHRLGDARLLPASTTSPPTSKSFPHKNQQSLRARKVKSDVKYRFSIDMASLKND